MQRNVMVKDLYLVIVVDEDFDIRNPLDVEYGMATDFEAAKNLITIPGARGQEYVRGVADGIRAKLGIDAMAPFEDKALFTRCNFEELSVNEIDLSNYSVAYDRLWARGPR